MKGLKIVNFLGINLPSWMMNTSYPFLLNNLVNLKFQNLILYEYIPPLGHLPHLKVVKIVGMDHLKKISNDFYGWTNLDSNASNICNSNFKVFPSLKKLVLDYLPCLEEWSDMDMMIGSSRLSFEIFPQLEILKVGKCKRLT